MAGPAVAVLSWARAPVVPAGGALRRLEPHALAAPVIRAALDRAGVTAAAVDAIVAGNALGAGGNPARLAALAAGLPDRVPALSVDTQCCAGLDAVAVAAGLIAAGSSGVVLAGGVEAWSRAPLRARRPLAPGEPAPPYEHPPFAPDPERDPDPFAAAAALAATRGIGRAAQDAHAAASHARAIAARAAMVAEIVPMGDPALDHDPFPRRIDAAFVRRVGVAAGQGDFAVSRLAAACRADGAAFVALAGEDTARRLGLRPRAWLRATAAAGAAPEMPLLAVQPAVMAALARAGLAAGDLWGVELHEAFAVQALALIADLGLDPKRVNRGGGGLARGHPIGASGAVALIRLLADLDHGAPAGGCGIAAIAAVGGLGAAALVERA